MQIKVLLIVLVIVFTTFSALQIQELKSEQNQGQYSPLIEAKKQHPNSPAQYYLCGVEFQSLKWEKTLWNCGCGQRWYNGRVRARCNWCVNNFWNKASGFDATFCHYKDWNDQILNKFSTGSSSAAGSLAKVMCPINTYASGFQGKFGFDKGQRLGFHGILLRCTSPDYKNSQNVQDYQSHPAKFNVPKYGLFLSSFKLKFVPGGMLTGIHMFAEKMSMIQKNNMGYDSTVIKSQQAILESNQEQNIGQNIVQVHKRNLRR